LCADRLAVFLSRRPHLFRIGRDQVVEAHPGAEPFLRYKRSLLEYLASHPPRVIVQEVAAEVPLPPGLPPNMEDMVRSHGRAAIVFLGGLDGKGSMGAWTRVGLRVLSACMLAAMLAAMLACNYLVAL